jgi:hypothetical protein
MTLRHLLPINLPMQSTRHLTLTHESRTILEYIKPKTVNQKALEKDNIAPIASTQQTHSVTRLSPRKRTLTFPFLPPRLLFLILTLLLLAFLLIFPRKQSMSIEAGQGIDGANAYHGAEPRRPLLLQESQS